MRHIVAISLYATTFGVVMFTNLNDHTVVGLSLAVVASIACGLVSGSWWALLLVPILPPMASIAECDADERCEVDPGVLVLAFWVPISGALMGLGVGARRLRARSPRPTSR